MSRGKLMNLTKVDTIDVNYKKAWTSIESDSQSNVFISGQPNVGDEVLMFSVNRVETGKTWTTEFKHNNIHGVFAVDLDDNKETDNERTSFGTLTTNNGVKISVTAPSHRGARVQIVVVGKNKRLIKDSLEAVIKYCSIPFKLICRSCWCIAFLLTVLLVYGLNTISTIGIRYRMLYIRHFMSDLRHLIPSFIYEFYFFIYNLMSNETNEENE